MEKMSSNVTVNSHKIKLFALLIVTLLLAGGLALPAEADNLPFEVDQLLIKTLIKSGDVGGTTLKITNTGSKSTSYNIEVFGLKEIVTVSELEFALKPGQSKTLNIEFRSQIPEKYITYSPGVYVGKFIISSKGQTYVLPLILEIESRDVLFDTNINVAPHYKELSPGENLVIDVRLFNLKSRQPESVTINYKIKDLDDNTLITETETVVVESQTSFIKSMRMPKNLDIGTYVFIVETQYGTSIGTASYLFSVLKGANPLWLLFSWVKGNLLFFNAALIAIILIIGLFWLSRGKIRLPVLISVKGKPPRKITTAELFARKPERKPKGPGLSTRLLNLFPKFNFKQILADIKERRIRKRELSKKQEAKLREIEEKERKLKLKDAYELEEEKAKLKLQEEKQKFLEEHRKIKEQEVLLRQKRLAEKELLREREKLEKQREQAKLAWAREKRRIEKEKQIEKEKRRREHEREKQKIKEEKEKLQKQIQEERLKQIEEDRKQRLAEVKREKEVEEKRQKAIEDAEKQQIEEKQKLVEAQRKKLEEGLKYRELREQQRRKLFEKKKQIELEEKRYLLEEDKRKKTAELDKLKALEEQRNKELREKRKVLEDHLHKLKRKKDSLVDDYNNQIKGKKRTLAHLKHEKKFWDARHVQAEIKRLASETPRLERAYKERTEKINKQISQLEKEHSASMRSIKQTETIVKSDIAKKEIKLEFLKALPADATIVHKLWRNYLVLRLRWRKAWELKKQRLQELYKIREEARKRRQEEFERQRKLDKKRRKEEIERREEERKQRLREEEKQRRLEEKRREEDRERRQEELEKERKLEEKRRREKEKIREEDRKQRLLEIVKQRKVAELIQKQKEKAKEEERKKAEAERQRKIKEQEETRRKLIEARKHEEARKQAAIERMEKRLGQAKKKAEELQLLEEKLRKSREKEVARQLKALTADLNKMKMKREKLLDLKNKLGRSLARFKPDRGELREIRDVKAHITELQKQFITASEDEKKKLEKQKEIKETLHKQLEKEKERLEKIESKEEAEREKAKAMQVLISRLAELDESYAHTEKSK